MKDSWTIGILSVIFVGFMLMMFWGHMEATVNGHNDFVAFYAGAKLLGNSNLYDGDALREEEGRALGMFSAEHGYVRLPFHAVLVWPLSRFPYLTAYAVWETALILGVIAFVVFWRPPGGAMNVLLASMSFPIFTCVANGQDTVFLLVFLMGAVTYYRRGQKFWAGAIYSLCAIKFHLFLLTPLLIVARREWRFARGLLAGGGCLAVISFAGAGWRWPLDFLESALNPQFSPRTFRMANLHGVMTNVPGGGVFEILIGILIVAAVWLICRRASFEYGLAAMLVGGFLLSVHAYLPDLVITLPAVLMLITRSQSKAVKIAAFMLALPPLHLLFFAGFPFTIAIPVVSFVVLAFMTRETLRASAGAGVLADAPADAD